MCPKSKLQAILRSLGNVADTLSSFITNRPLLRSFVPAPWSMLNDGGARNGESVNEGRDALSCVAITLRVSGGENLGG